MLTGVAKVIAKAYGTVSQLLLDLYRPALKPLFLHFFFTLIPRTLSPISESRLLALASVC